MQRRSTWEQVLQDGKSGRVTCYYTAKMSTLHKDTASEVASTLRELRKIVRLYSAPEISFGAEPTEEEEASHFSSLKLD